MSKSTRLDYFLALFLSVMFLVNSLIWKFGLYVIASFSSKISQKVLGRHSPSCRGEIDYQLYFRYNKCCPAAAVREWMLSRPLHWLESTHSQRHHPQQLVAGCGATFGPARGNTSRNSKISHIPPIHHPSEGDDLCSKSVRFPFHFIPVPAFFFVLHSYSY
jgi:hypothetical protein